MPREPNRNSKSRVYTIKTGGIPGLDSFDHALVDALYPWWLTKLSDFNLVLQTKTSERLFSIRLPRTDKVSRNIQIAHATSTTE
jgi:hypothetical protein